MWLRTKLVESIWLRGVEGRQSYLAAAAAAAAAASPSLTTPAVLEFLRVGQVRLVWHGLQGQPTPLGSPPTCCVCMYECMCVRTECAHV